LSRSFALRLELGEVPITGPPHRRPRRLHSVRRLDPTRRADRAGRRSGHHRRRGAGSTLCQTPKEAPLKRTTALLTGLIAGLATSAATAPAAPIATSAGLPTLTLAMNGKSIHVSGSMKAGRGHRRREDQPGRSSPPRPWSSWPGRSPLPRPSGRSRPTVETPIIWMATRRSPTTRPTARGPEGPRPSSRRAAGSRSTP